MRKASLKRDIAYLEGQISVYNRLIWYLNDCEPNVTVLRLRDKVLNERASCIRKEKELYLNEAEDKIIKKLAKKQG